MPGEGHDEEGESKAPVTRTDEDEEGALAALKEARGKGEEWILERITGLAGHDQTESSAAATNEESLSRTPPSRFYMRTHTGRFLTLTAPSSAGSGGGGSVGGRDSLVRAPRLTTLVEPNSHGHSELVIKMQAGFKAVLTAAKAEKAEQKITRAEIEREAGRKLDDETIKRLKKARRKGTYREEMLDVRTKGKGDKFA